MSNLNAAEAENQESNVASIGNNSDNLKDIIIQSAKEMADIDEQRKGLNREAADIRETLKDKGIDTDAFKDAYQYFKKQRHQREGYDEYHKLCFDALNAADTGELFAVAAE